MDRHNFINSNNLNNSIKCKTCGGEIFTKELCKKCYQKEYYKKHSSKIKNYGRRGITKQALERDNFTCKKCKVKKPRNKLVVVKKNDDKDYKLNNLMILCKSCSPDFFKSKK